MLIAILFGPIRDGYLFEQINYVLLLDVTSLLVPGAAVWKTEKVGLR